MKKTIMKLVAGLLAMAVCFGNTPMTTLASAPDETFTFVKKSVTMNEGEYATIETSATQPLEWSAANLKIVDLNEDGVVYGKKQGSTRVTAKLGTVKKNTNVKVIRSTLRLNKGDITLYVGNDGATSFRLKGTVRGADKGISFESSDPEIAAVDANGNVTGVSEGTALITARANNNYAYCKVNVLEKGITLNNSSLNLATKGVGSSIRLLADVVGPKKNIKWTTSDKTVATVSGGTVRGRKEGTAVVTATANGVSTSCYVTVYGPETFEEQVGKKVKKTQVFTTYGLSESQVTLYAGMKKADAKQLKCSAPKKDKVRWISSDENVAQVLNNGKVIAVGEGTAYISVESDVTGYTSAKCRVDVKASTVDIAEDSVTVKTKGAKQKYTLASSVCGKNKNISWKSSNTKVATVSRGIVTGKKEGTAVITATANGVSDTVTVNVVAYDDTMRLADEAEKPAVHVHTWSDWAVSVKAPAGGMGKESRYCTSCKMVQNRSYTAPEQEEPEKPEESEKPEPEKPEVNPDIPAPYTRVPADYESIVEYAATAGAQSPNGKVGQWEKRYMVLVCDCGEKFETRDAFYSHLETMTVEERDRHLPFGMDSVSTKFGREEAVYAYAYYRCSCGYESTSLNTIANHSAKSSGCDYSIVYVEVDGPDAPGYEAPKKDDDSQAGEDQKDDTGIPAPYTRKPGDYEPVIEYAWTSHDPIANGKVQQWTKRYIVLVCGCGEKFETQDALYSHLDPMTTEERNRHLKNGADSADMEISHEETVWAYAYYKCTCGFEAADPNVVNGHQGQTTHCAAGPVYVEVEGPGSLDYGEELNETIPAPIPREPEDYQGLGFCYQRMFYTPLKVQTWDKVSRVMACECGETFNTKDAFYSHIDPMTVTERKIHSAFAKYAAETGEFTGSEMKEGINNHHAAYLHEDVKMYAYYECSCGFRMTSSFHLKSHMEYSEKHPDHVIKYIKVLVEGPTHPGYTLPVYGADLECWKEGPLKENAEVRDWEEDPMKEYAETGDGTEAGDSTETGDDTQTGTETGDDAQTGTETGDDTQTGTETGDDTGTVWQPDTGDDDDSASASAGCDASVTIPEEPETEEPAPEEPEKKPVIKKIVHWCCGCGADFTDESEWKHHAMESLKKGLNTCSNYHRWLEEVEVYE